MLKLIKGDVFEISICPCDIPAMLIDRLVFSSKDLNIEEDAFIDNCTFHVRIVGERTKDFPIGFVHYDLTVFLVDGQRLTIKHNELIEIVGKMNEVRDE